MVILLMKMMMMMEHDDEENHDDDDDCNYLKIRKCEARTARARRIEVLAGRTRNL